MERLKPILNQKFWILLVLAMIMTLSGWWTATASINKKIKERVDTILAADKNIPAKDKIPREVWTSELEKINTAQKNSITRSRADLWIGQMNKLLDWPAEVQPRGGYKGTFSIESKDYYKEPNYVNEVTAVWKQLRPLEDDGTGIVDYALENMYNVLGKKPAWPTTITDDEMWNIKEDLVLLEVLFQSIATVNGGPNVPRTVDMIHRIDRLELRGGGGAKPKSVPPAAAIGAAADLPMISADFNPAEEFGDDGSAAAQGKNIPGKAPPTIRYIVKDGPFKTRGFYLSVKMDHQKIPQLIAELTANGRSKFPVEVLRVQMSRLHEDSLSSAGGGAGGAATTSVRRQVASDSGATATMPFLARIQANGIDLTDQIRLSASTLDKSLSNPTMAQVAICGVFTLFQKVDVVPEVKPPGPATPTVTPKNADSQPETTIVPDADTAEPGEMTDHSDQAPAEMSDNSEEMSPVAESPNTEAMSDEKKMDPDSVKNEPLEK